MRLLLLTLVLAVPTWAEATCRVHTNTGLIMRTAVVDGSRSKVKLGLTKQSAWLEGDLVRRKTGLLTRKAGWVEDDGFVVKHGLRKFHTIEFSAGQATLKTGLTKRRFHWNSGSCSAKQAALGAIHLTHIVFDQQAQANQPLPQF